MFHCILAFQCGRSNCSEKFGSLSLLKEHESENHESARSGVLKASRQSEKKYEKISFECYLCRKKTFRSFRKVKLHLKKHDIPSIGKCSVCLTKMYTSQLEGHLCKNVAQANGDGSIDCEYCPEKFQSITKLFRHIDDEHANVKTLYRCINCPNTYPVKNLLEYHHTAHTNHTVAIFKCNKCSKNRSFETLHALNQHIKLHETKEGTFFVSTAIDFFFFVVIDSNSKLIPFYCLISTTVHLCDVCGAALKSKRNLKIHKLVHTEPQLQCDQCPKKFVCISHLRKHKNFHSKQTFSCHLCDFKCTSSDRLCIHISKLKLL